jgi:hypothetical protein
MRKLLNYISRKVSSLFGTAPLITMAGGVTAVRSILEHVYVDGFLKENLFHNQRYIQSLRITHFHKSVFAQNGEDGIIEEIFRRIGLGNKYFVEFGVHGVKNNSTFLLLKGWSGLWIGAEKNSDINGRFRQVLNSGALKFAKRWVTNENIEEILRENGVPEDFDFLSIDLDGNDYWIWRAITKYSPRVVCIEYNATFPSGTSWIMSYNPTHQWDTTSYFGASLKALEVLGKQKGYALVGCDFSGCNAFFVRSDQSLDLFEAPFTSENHYEPPRYFLARPSGHTPGFGPFTSGE